MKNNRALLLGIGMPCVSLLFLILMLCLWEYRILIGLAIAVLIAVVVGVFVRGMVIEQNLRIYRFAHKEETPLDMTNQPMVLRPDMRENPNRQNHYQQQAYYQGYQQ